MAEIPVQRKSSGLLWLIPVALIAMLGVTALTYNTINSAETDEPVQAVSTETRTSKTITNDQGTVTTQKETIMLTQNQPIERVVEVNAFSEAPDKLVLVGRDAAFDQVPVGRVLSDRMFTIVSGNTEFYALLDPILDSAGGNEARVVVKPGQLRSVVGRFTAVPSAALKEEQSTDLPLDSQEYQQLKNEQVYLHVTNISN